MYEILFNAASGAVSGAIAFLIARAVTPRNEKPRLHFVVVILVFVVVIQLVQALAGPPFRGWIARQEIDRYLESDLFSAKS